jgi:flagellar hook protein FlgE
MSFQQGLSGLNSAAKSLDVIGNNIANSATAGFKAGSARFSDIYAASSGAIPNGLGSRVNSVQTNFSQGSLTTTGNPLDMSIGGDGFFIVDNKGVPAYTRAGQFDLTKTGDIVTPAGQNVRGYGIDANGILNTSTLVNLNISMDPLPPAATAKAVLQANLDARDTVKPTAAFDPNDPATYNSLTSMKLYDSLGVEHTMSNFFLKQGTNSYVMRTTIDGTDLGTTENINFLSTGKLDTATSSAMPLTVAYSPTTGATAPTTFSLDMSGFTQYSDAFAINVSDQDGTAPARMADYSVDQEGMITAKYTNGKTKALGQVVIANFTNKGGLQPVSDNLYLATSQSGSATVNKPGAGNAGLLNAGSIEESNVDMTKELVNLITAQRNYQANAQTIKTQDGVLQTALNLK